MAAMVMHATSETTPSRSLAPRLRFVAAVAACWLVLGLWITGQSLWLDEGMAVSKSVMPTFGEFWKGFSATRGSDIQQPLFMLSSWAWAKVVGRSEWGLRALNWLWMALAFGYAASRKRWNRRTRLLWCALAALSPFVAMFMDEAKGYILHFTGGTLMFLAVAEGSGRPAEKFAFGAFSLGLLLTCGSALTGVVYAFWPCLWLLVRLVREKAVKRFLAARWAWLSIDAALLAVFAGWYIHTLLVGARGTDMGPPTVSTMAFLGYEWLGFSGVGPARLVMRVEGARATLPFALPLALYAAGLAFFAFEWWRTWRQRTRGAGETAARRFHVPAYAVPLLLGAMGLLSMLVVGVVDDMAVRARHVMPVFPAALLVVAVWADRMLAAVRRAPRAAVAVLLAALAASSLAFRFGERHGKEDYRRATAMAVEALREGRCVWWSADGNTAFLYGAYGVGTGRFALCLSPTPGYLAELPPPDLVFVNRPDTWDGRGVLAGFIARQGWQVAESFHGFRVYRPAAENAGTGPDAEAAGTGH